MPSFAPCLHEEADIRIFAHATEAAKGLIFTVSSTWLKKISTVDTDVVFLVIPVVQQL